MVVIVVVVVVDDDDDDDVAVEVVVVADRGDGMDYVALVLVASALALAPVLAHLLVLVLVQALVLALELALVSAPRGPCPCAVLGTGSNPSIEGTVGPPITPSPSPNTVLKGSWPEGWAEGVSEIGLFVHYGTQSGRQQ